MYSPLTFRDTVSSHDDHSVDEKGGSPHSPAKRAIPSFNLKHDLLRGFLYSIHAVFGYVLMLNVMYLYSARSPYCQVLIRLITLGRSRVLISSPFALGWVLARCCLVGWEVWARTRRAMSQIAHSCAEVYGGLAALKFGYLVLERINYIWISYLYSTSTHTPIILCFDAFHAATPASAVVARC